MTRVWQRGVMFGFLGAVLMAGRGCAGTEGTNTGNALCPAAEACSWPASIAGPEGKDWRGMVALNDLAPVSIHFHGQPVTTDGERCESAFPGDIRGDIPLRAEENWADPVGALRLRFEDPRTESAWTNGRPLISTDPGSPDGYFAYAMDLKVSPDGWLTATLTVVYQHSSWDGGFHLEEEEAGTVQIEGPLSVDCPAGETTREIPTSDGIARIRCAIVSEPQVPCDDTDTYTGCSVSGWRR